MRAVCVLALLGILLPAASRAQGSNEFVVERAAQPPRIDGLLDDAVWSRAPLAIPPDGWVSYQPVRGDTMSADFRTEVRIAYDDRSIYFAFHCFDHEPDRIRTTVSKRDNAFSDDWIAISLDSNGTGQTAYHLFSNPSGSQMDALNTASSGEQFDADFVWFSAAKVTADGYVVEVQIPLQTLRFSGSDQVRMGLVFFRKISRIGISYSWPEMLPGQWVFERPAHLLFDNLKPRRLMELLPSVTYSVNQARATAEAWDAVLGKANVGLNGKFGVTSSVTLDGTVNPDFSQIESDAYQVEVNKRFPVFYSEKRPFFMEGMGLFNIAGTGGGDGNMRTAVHTRRIVDPNWGSKLTGTVGKTTFGVLNAQDDHPDDVGDRGDVFTTRDKLFTIGRATYALRRSDYVGAIFTDTNHAGRHNQVIGGDLSVRPSSAQQLSATILSSRTSIEGDDTDGNGMQASYRYETRRFMVQSQAEHYDRDFQMDTAFYNRTGFSTVWLFSEVNFYPASRWLQRVHPFVFAKAGHDDLQQGNEDFANTGLRFNFTRQGFVEVAHGQGHEAWHGQRYEVGDVIFVFARMQAFRWLEVYAGNGRGPAIYYDEDPFQGRSVNVFGGITLQPNQHLRESLELDTVRFKRQSTGARVYDVNIINSKTTYQFDKHFLVRYQAQYDSSESRFLSDVLASYEFVPGTVFHLGYGSLYERRADANGMLVPVEDGERYLTVNRGLFFKASYLKRF